MVTVSDPTRLEVLKNALEGIADVMALTVFRASRSSIVRMALDYSTGVLNSKGEMIAQGLCLPIQMGGMEPALETCLQRYRGRLEPGDVLINNDPYEGGSHLPDVFLFKPVFYGGKLVGYVCDVSHHADMGGRVAGSHTCDNTEIYQEGLRIPPLKLYEAGRPNETLFRLLEKAVRVPDIVLGDFMGQLAGLDSAEREYLRLVQRYGLEEFERYTEELVEYTEELTRKAIASLPDGQWSFTDYIDDDGFSPDAIPIVANVTKKGEELQVDFTGTGPQCKGSIQLMFQNTRGLVYAAVKTLLSSLNLEIPNTVGYYRPVTITAPVGSFVNPLPPAPVAARNLGGIRVFQAVMGAFAQMLPDKIPACSGGTEFVTTIGGYDKRRLPWRPWVLTDAFLEIASGGFPHRDGLDAQHCYSTNIALTPAETIEIEIPVHVGETSLIPDSEGAGKFRGGLGICRSYRYLQDDAVVTVRADRMKRQPYGLQGGQASRRTYITINHDRDSRRDMPSKFVTHMNDGDTMRVEVPGGGGWGDPLERDPEMALEDVTVEKVSVERARDAYGVVVDVERHAVDWEATRRRREELREGRRKGAD